MIDTVRTEDLQGLVRARAQAEAAEHAAALAYFDQEWDKTLAEDSLPLRQSRQRSIILTLGQSLGLSEAQADQRVATARRLRDHTPRTWQSFLDGDIDAARALVISRTIDKLERDESHAILDDSASAYAATHTVPELRRWLRRFVQRVEADLATERANEEREHRTVLIDHGDDGMSWIHAYVPSHVAAAIGKRLRVHAKALGSDDPRNRGQRMADLFASWLTTNDANDIQIAAHIGVTVDAGILAGATTGFGQSTDGSWGIPSGWVADLAAGDNAFWHRLLLDPVSNDILSHEYLGRFAPELLARALEFRDGVCQAPGCLRPADECDLDHRQPSPDGPTSAANMWPLCRKHHTMKGFNLIRWILPDGTTRSAEPAR